MRSSFLPLFGLRHMVAPAFALLLAVSIAPAATLSFDATMYIQPDENAPAVGTLPSGTSIKSLLREELAAAGLDLPPAGWIAIRHSGPFAGFVENRNVQKDGSIKPGAEIRAQPLADAPLLLVVEAGDKTEAREPVGDWSRATIHTDLVVFVNALPPASRRQQSDVSPPPDTTAAGDTIAPAPPVDTETTAKPAKPAKVETPRKEREVKPEPAPVETNGAPRVFEGYLLHTRRFLGHGPKYDYELVDENNQRIALLDVSSLLATSPISSFEDRRISIYGPSITVPGVKDLIIRVQRLRLLK